MIGLLVVLLMLGHDASMAGTAHASPFPSTRHGIASADASHPGPPRAVAHGRRRGRAAAHRAPVETDGSDDGTPLPHPASCASVWSAIPRPDGDDGRAHPGARIAVVAPSRLRIAPPATEPRGELPTRPPGTRRALLKVYRL